MGRVLEDHFSDDHTDDPCKYGLYDCGFLYKSLIRNAEVCADADVLLKPDGLRVRSILGLFWNHFDCIAVYIQDYREANYLYQ